MTAAEASWALVWVIVLVAIQIWRASTPALTVWALVWVIVLVAILLVATKGDEE